MESNLPIFGRRRVVFGGLALVAILSLGGTPSHAADPAPAAATSSAATTNDEADKAWKETKKLTQPPMPPPSWQEKEPSREEIQKFYNEALSKGANAAKDFYTRYPNSPKVAEAHQIEFRLLNIAVNQFGDTNQTARLDALTKQRMADPKLSEDERFELRVGEVQRLMRGGGNTDALEKSALALQKDFPKREEVYQILIMVLSESEGEKARSLAKQIVDNPSAPEQAKEEAKGVLKRLEALGKPVDIAFTAVDGRDVNLSKMKGKVVLVDFWATWCGPCMGEVPHVKAAYEKLHDKGFEIVGISFDQSKDTLNKTLKEKGMTWPQYFDGEGWHNKYGVQFGINSIPTMWLVDKKGNLRDVNARGELEDKVTKLLAEQ